MSSKIATLAELQTIYGVEDGYDLLEIVLVDHANERRARERVKPR